MLSLHFREVALFVRVLYKEEIFAYPDVKDFVK